MNLKRAKKASATSGLYAIIPLLLLLLLPGGCVSQETVYLHSERSSVPIALMYPLYSEPPNSPELLAYIEERFQIRLELQAIAPETYNRRSRIGLIAGNGPDALVWTHFPQAELFHYARTGLLRPLDPLLEEAEHLAAIPEEIWTNAMIDDQLYGIPRPRAREDQAYFIRKDWLDALGLPHPHTTDELAEAAIRFASDDPDGNGRPDTYGFAAGDALETIYNISHAFDAGNSWRLQEDGSLLNSHLAPGREAALRWMRTLYSQGGIDPLFGTLNSTQVQEQFTSGRAGILLSEISNFHPFLQRLQEQVPGSEIIMLPPPAGPEGKSGLSAKIGFFGQFVIPSRVPEDKARRIVELLDWMSGEEAEALRRSGLEGIHHTQHADGTFELYAARMEAEGIGAYFPMNGYDPYYYVSTTAPEETRLQQRSMLDQVRSLGVSDPALHFMPHSRYKIGSIYASQIESFYVQYVRSEIQPESFDEFRAAWLEKGGRELTEEVNRWYR
ncbi:extracellular solute-binding protein [Paenibacillus sp. 1P07SE]|uniref:extracellular solute-binding protein n=1 Tax=Paenibacillus sp. 1P07SE TaxID=3132209 RepID=UPI0039A6ECC2